MRIPMYVAAAVALLALAPQTARAALVSSASVLLECLPYLAAATLLAPFLGRFSRAAVAFAGCGCGRVPGALSIPAAIATALLFGPFAACARFAAAIVAWRSMTTDTHAHESSLLDELQGLVPSAVLCACVSISLPWLHLTNIPATALFGIGVAIGAFATPCALGGVALASAVHASAPWLSYGVLCTSGIFTFRLFHLVGRLRDRCLATWRGTRTSAPHDSARALCDRVRIPRLALPAALTFAVIIGAPMPDVVANETTLTDAYPGERISFAGSYERGALIRYAITCCRADASPVVVRLSQPLRAREHSWWRVDGTIVRQGASLALATRNAIPIAPPSDPFIYR